jgi:hypothetical protein
MKQGRVPRHLRMQTVYIWVWSRAAIPKAYTVATCLSYAVLFLGWLSALFYPP